MKYRVNRFYMGVDEIKVYELAGEKSIRFQHPGDVEPDKRRLERLTDDRWFNTRDEAEARIARHQTAQIRDGANTIARAMYALGRTNPELVRGLSPQQQALVAAALELIEPNKEQDHA